MADIVRDTLDERIKELEDYLGETELYSDEYAAAVKNLETLYKLRMEEKKWMNDQDTMLEDVNLRVKEHFLDRKKLVVDWVRTILPPVAGLAGMALIIGKEDIGAVTSKAFSLATSFFRIRG